MEDFKIRSYTKKELALMYFPDSNPRTAANHLRAWIYRCKPLLEQLEAAGYKRISKMFTPRQVRLSVHTLAGQCDASNHPPQTIVSHFFA